MGSTAAVALVRLSAAVLSRGSACPSRPARLASPMTRGRRSTCGRSRPRAHQPVSLAMPSIPSSSTRHTAARKMHAEVTTAPGDHLLACAPDRHARASSGSCGRHNRHPRSLRSPSPKWSAPCSAAPKQDPGIPYIFFSRFVTFFSRFYVHSLEYSYVVSDPNFYFRSEVRSYPKKSSFGFKKIGASEA